MLVGLPSNSSLTIRCIIFSSRWMTWSISLLFLASASSRSPKHILASGGLFVFSRRILAYTRESVMLRLSNVEGHRNTGEGLGSKEKKRGLWLANTLVNNWHWRRQGLELDATVRDDEHRLEAVPASLPSVDQYSRERELGTAHESVTRAGKR